MKIHDDGSLMVKIDSVEILVDLYGVSNSLADIHASKSHDAGEENRAIVELVESLGFPRVSQRAAVKFANAIHDAVCGLRAKDAIQKVMDQFEFDVRRLCQEAIRNRLAGPTKILPNFTESEAAFAHG